MGWGRKGLMFCEFSDPGDTYTHTYRHTRTDAPAPLPPAIVLQSRFVYLPLIWGCEIGKGN